MNHVGPQSHHTKHGLSINFSFRPPPVFLQNWGLTESSYIYIPSKSSHFHAIYNGKTSLFTGFKMRLTEISYGHFP